MSSQVFVFLKPLLSKAVQSAVRAFVVAVATELVKQAFRNRRA